MIPFEQINEVVLAAYPGVLFEWFPNGKLVGREFLIGNIHGDAGDSLSINVVTGKWAEFNGELRGGDPISLFAAAFHAQNRIDAAKTLGTRHGVYTNGRDVPSSGIVKAPLAQKSRRAPEVWLPAPFPPVDAEPPSFAGYDHVYAYRSGDGYINRYVFRQDAKEGKRKVFHQWTWGSLDKGDGKGAVVGWHPKAGSAPRCLYGLDRLYEMPGATVVICMGEKASDAAQLLFPRNPCLTWSGGDAVVADNDWSEVAGRRCLIWPDNDASGAKAGVVLAGILEALGCKVATLRVDDIFDADGKGGDAADISVSSPNEWLKARLDWSVATDPVAEKAGGVRRGAGVEAVRVVEGEIDLTATAGEKALMASGMPVFQRSALLMRPGVSLVPASNERMVMAASLVEITPPAMIDLLNQACPWERYNGREKAWRNCNPPKDVGAIIQSRVGQWQFNTISGVITAPTLRPDGSCLSKPGYDVATRLYYQPDPSLKLDANRLPTGRKDAEKALELLRELVSGFPFVGPLDRSVAYSALLTPVVRGMMSVAPLHAFRANTAGTGKSYLVDVASAISCGRPCPALSAGPDEKELEKRLVGLLIAGFPLISIDNVNGELGGDLLCQAVERPLIRVRQMQTSNIPEIQNCATIFANGNNMKIKGDMSRRSLLSDLDAHMEQPELRAFAFDPVERVLADRAKYVGACLTIVRAFIVSQAKPEMRPFLSYNGWSASVRGALVWLGEPDPAASVDRAREDDPVLGDLREALVRTSEVKGVGSKWTVRELVEIASRKQTMYSDEGPKHENADLHEALMRIAPDRSEINSLRLGKWLSSIEGRIVSGLCFRRVGGTTKGATWQVEKR